MKGKSDAVDTKWGRDIKDKRPRCDWGPQDIGLRATIVVTKFWNDKEEVYENRVENVVAEGALQAAQAKAEAELEEDVKDIPF
jgi:hypothetical protein